MKATHIVLLGLGGHPGPNWELTIMDGETPIHTSQIVGGDSLSEMITNAISPHGLVITGPVVGEHGPNEEPILSCTVVEMPTENIWRVNLTFGGCSSYAVRDFEAVAEAAQYLAEWEPLSGKFPLAGDQERITTWLLEHGDFYHAEPDVEYMDDVAQARQLPLDALPQG